MSAPPPSPRRPPPRRSPELSDDDPARPVERYLRLLKLVLSILALAVSIWQGVGLL